jgi:hypothetical protein
VPANVAFAISILDDNGRRTSQRHQNWLTVRPGESVECVGCHTAGSEVPHGRLNAGPITVNQGASTIGAFPNSEPGLSADLGETMAEVYALVNGVRNLSADIVYEDEWTDADVTAKADPINYLYDDLQSNSPVGPSSPCLLVGSSLCRLTINYPEHIHPIWQVDRRVFDVDEVTVLEDNTCTSCHNNVDDMDVAMVPVAQLDLSSGASDLEADHFKSYRELLSTDNEQELNGGILQDRLVDTGEVERNEDGDPILDAEGNTTPIFAPVPVAPTKRPRSVQLKR